MKSLFKLGSTSVSIRIGRMGLGVLSNAALARLMAPHDFGVLAFAIATTTLIAIPGEGGMTSLATREVVKKRVSNDLPGLRGFIYFANATVLSLSLTSVLIAALIVGILWTVSPDVRYPTLMVTLGSVIFGPMANTRAGILRGLGSPILSQIPEQIIRPGMLTLIAATAFFLGYRSIAPEWGAAMYLTSSAIAFAVGTAVLVIYYKRHVPSGDRVVQTREWLSSLLPFSLVAAVQVAMGQTAMVVLGMVRPPTDTAIFRIVTLIGDVVGFSVLALGVLVGPRIAELYHKGEFAELNKLLRRTARYNVMFGAIIVAGIIIVSPFVIPVLFRPEYSAAYVPLCVYAIGQLCCLGVGMAATLANMSGHEKMTVRSAMIGLCLNVALSFVLCRYYGPVGAALSAVTSTFVSKLILAVQVYRKTSINSWAV